jgi:hypothetical protein
LYFDVIFQRWITDGQTVRVVGAYITTQFFQETSKFISKLFGK